MEAAAVSAAVSMTLKVVGNKLAPLLIKEYSNIVGVRTHLHELRNQVEDINNWLETRHETMWNDPSLNWLKRLKDVAYDVDDVVDEFQLKAEKDEGDAGGGLMSKYMVTNPKSFILKCKVASKIKKIKKRFADIVKQRADFITIANSLPCGHPVHHMNNTTSEMKSLTIVDAASVLGRDQDRDKIITELVNTSVQQQIEIISVIGLGGSGKSTLAKLIFSDRETIKEHFELTLWVYVSEKFDDETLIKKLFEAVTEEKSDRYTLPHISAQISARLNVKRFLLILDDVWTEDRIQWEQFMVHLKSGPPGSKILLTTRSRRVAEAMESIYIFDLPFLSFNDSWQLFYHSFGAGATGLSPEFQKVGKQIVRKCGGVPLAIKSLAGVLCGIERRIEDWEAVRDNNLLNVQKEDRVAACLRLSYTHLQYDLKQCFTICSVFPKGHKIYKEQLIDLWIAHDMISMDYTGNKHFNSLVQISFLQNVEEEGGRVTCTMHDLVSDLAQRILGDEISFVVPREAKNSTKSYRYFSLREQPEVIVPKNIFEKARAVYITKCYDHIFGMALEKAKHLRSVTVGSPYVTALPNAVFQIKNLKYLSMSRLNCEELPDAISDVWSLQALHITDSLYLLRLPESIGKLKKLRALNLSGCQYLNGLPDSIGDCHMISNIDLWHCEDLTVLPNSIGRNKELRVLRLACTGLMRLPCITTLENLQCMDLRRCRKLVELPEGIENLKKLEVLNLEGSLVSRSLTALKGQLFDQVQDLNIFVGRSEISEHTNIILGNGGADADQSFVSAYVREDDVHKTCIKQKTNLQGLKLKLLTHDTAEVDNESVQGVLDDLEPPPGVKTLDIHGYPGKQYRWWMQNQVGGGVQGPAPFPFLRVMNLIDFPNLKHLHGLVELHCLEELKLKQMPSLESISGGPFPSLVNLEMRDLPCLGQLWMVAEGIMPDEEEGGGFTPQLGQFRVGNCLTVLKISECPKLEVKPHLLLSLQHLKWSPGQCVGSSSSPSFSHLKNLHLWNVKGLGSGYGWELLQHMTALESLEIINYSGVQTELPESLWSLISLRSLEVSYSRVLPEFLGELRSLQQLTIKSYCSSSLPQTIGQLTSLRSLRVVSSNIHVLPESLGELRSLQQLTIECCHSLVYLPQSMGQLTSLQELVIEGCEALKQLPDCLGELCSLCKLKINYLLQLTCLPESLGELRSLQELTIKSCYSLVYLPQSMGQLKSLQELVIEGCVALKQLPDCLGELCSLRKLKIKYLAELTCLPQSICRLTTSLRDLYVYGCPGLTSLLQGREGLVSLENLSIR